MKTETIFVKVKCTGENKRLPSQDLGFCFTNIGMGKIDEDGQWSNDNGYVVRPNWWLEELEEQVVMTKDEYNSLNCDECDWRKTADSTIECFKCGQSIEW